MKYSNWILGLIVALAILLCYWMAYGQTPVNNIVNQHVYVLPQKIALEWKIVDETRIWLSINNMGGTDWKWEGYHPSFTYIMSQYRPIVKQLRGGQFEITFTSEIAKDLP